MAEKPFDPTLKTLVETTPEAWPVVVGQTPGPTEVVDADVALTVSGAADKVLRVGADAPYLLHLDFQSGHDSAELPPLLHVRNAVLGHRHGLLVHSVAVLLRPEADSPALTGKLQRAFPGKMPYLIFEYQVFRVWEKPPALFLSGGPGLLPLAPVSAVTTAELPGIIQQMEAALSRRSMRGRAPDVWAAAYVLMGLRYPRDLLNTLLRGVMSMKESVTYQAIVEEGVEKGKALGKAEGAIEGAKEELRKVLRFQGEDRFGAPDPRVIAALARIDDLVQLEALARRLLTAQSWQELLDLPAPRRSSGRRR
jgi:predicted transposase YdaD